MKEDMLRTNGPKHTYQYNVVKNIMGLKTDLTIRELLDLSPAA